MFGLPLTKILGGSTFLLVIALGLTFAWGKSGWSLAETRDVQMKAQKATFVAMIREAAFKAEAARLATENKYAQLARSADNANAENDRLRSAAGRFADARRVRSGLACRPPGGAAAPAEDRPAPDRDGPGRDPVGDGAVVLTRPEYDQFVANTLRLERVRLWGESLIRQDLAIPEVEFGRGPGD